VSQRLVLRRPDDWHLHLRDGAMMQAVLPATAAVMGRAVVMPNLLPPVVTSAQALAYWDRIRSLLPAGSSFQPLMTAYLTEDSDPDDLAAGHRDGLLVAVKLYPVGATTHSDAGVRDLSRIDPVLERMQARGMPLLVHGEVTDPEVDIFDREAVFLDRVLAPLLDRYPELRVVLEHVTTAEGVDFVRARAPQVAATLTPQHLLANRNDMLVGGIRPHFYCLPVLKRRRHQQALIQAATSGDASFFLGTDSAPHAVSAKESACGCAGCFTAPVALPLYAEVFETAGALEQLEAFASLNGPAFYGLPPNGDRIGLERAHDTVPERILVDGPQAELRPWLAGRALRWRVTEHLD